ncbi:MAG: AMP-binding protein [Acidimicrobiia bacterium]|nr:AMP-binding protein [Acidimicrobiia bacterium]
MDWEPDGRVIAAANISRVLSDRDLASVDEFHAWSVANRDEFWRSMIDRLGILFSVAPAAVSTGPARNTRWLPGAQLNIARSCFQGADDSVAVVYQTKAGSASMSVAELRTQVQTCAGGLRRAGIGEGDRVAMAMAMSVESIIGYLALVWVGATVVSIADSFAAAEIQSRLALVECETVITQDEISRGGRRLPMYTKVIEAGAKRCIVVDTQGNQDLRPQDIAWDDLFVGNPMVEPTIRPVASHTNLLFSSGTTGTPKVIPWDHSSAIKAATDGFLHQDIHPGDVVAWPTNLGWMMGPWLIYAALLNRATIALSSEIPTSLGFCQFVTDAKVNVLGVVPALVRAWRSEPAVASLDWSAVRVVTSTGEASAVEDMRWLMGITGAPVIEYCGGTEIGGGYLSSTVVEPFDASTFTTPCFGLDIRLFDDGVESSTEGEVFLVPPSIGLSTELLNRDHQAVYYDGVPASDVPLRRHGDQLRRLPNGHYRAMGRSDDTMNLGGVKVSSAEIERVVNLVPGVVECAAVGVPPDGGGPDRLVVFAVAPNADPALLQPLMQAAIRADLNPLFKVAQVRLIESMPRTASAKVMRRTLRDLV